MAYTYETVPLIEKDRMRGAPYSITAAKLPDDQLDFLIDAATSMLETECDRHFMERDYSQWRDGSGMQYLTLPEWPLNTVSRVSVGRQDAISVINNNATASEAYAEINRAQTLLRLTLLDGTDAAAGTIDVALGAGISIATIAATVTGLGFGWSGDSVSDWGDRRSTTLRPTGRRECFESSCYFQVPDDGSADYTVDYDYGQLVLSSGYRFALSARNVYVEYNAGYETAPAVLQHICAELVQMTYHKGGKDLAMKTERLGDYSYTLGGSTIIDPYILSSADMQKRLAPFKDNSL